MSVLGKTDCYGASEAVSIITIGDSGFVTAHILSKILIESASARSEEFDEADTHRRQ